MRPIDADALKDELELADFETDSRMLGGQTVLFEYSVFKIVDSAPTISPDDVRGVGEWMLLADQNPEDVKAGNYAYWCSRCYAGDVHAKTQEVPYCWKCGARMKGAEDGD